MNAGLELMPGTIPEEQFVGIDLAFSSLDMSALQALILEQVGVPPLFFVHDSIVIECDAFNLHRIQSQVAAMNIRLPMLWPAVAGA